jgi:hypothetical protein
MQLLIIRIMITNRQESNGGDCDKNYLIKYGFLFLEILRVETWCTHFI